MLSLAGCIIVNAEGDLLMLHRKTPNRTQWEVPGGKVDAGEDPQKTAMRELKEELGVEVRITKKLGEREFTEDGHTMHYTWFLATIIAGEPRLAEPKTYDKFGYLTFVTLGRRWDELSPNTQNFMEEVALGRITL